jgi:hypothetical protein
MKVIKLVLFLAVVGVAYQWYTHQPKTGPETLVSANGFIALPTLVNADPKQVVVFAPENCPKEDAQRSDALAQQLTQRNIPSVRSHDVSFTSSDPDPGIGARLNAVMNGEFPIVFVKGRGKANPTLDEVIAEYGATR